MTMTKHDLVQGSPEWLEYRRSHLNASDAPAMMGVSKYKSRDQLLKQYATGVTEEFSEFKERLLASGHEFETLARPLAEEIVGEELEPVVASLGKLSASYDGLTDPIRLAFEHKRMNAALREVLNDPDCTGSMLPIEYRVQIEQQCIVAGCQRVLFMASRWSNEGELIEEGHCWYTSDPELAASIVRGWDQFEEDARNYKPAPAEATPVIGSSPDQLPALRIEISGRVTASNIAEFRAVALNAIRSVNLELVTDQDFADASLAAKWFEEVESRVKAAKQHALSQTADIDAMFKALEDISKGAREGRLAITGQISRRNEELRGEIVEVGRKEWVKHLAAIEKRLGGAFMPGITADFGLQIKGKRSFSSMRSAINDELARLKIESNETADKIQLNLSAIARHAGFEFLFSDKRALVLKDPEDLVLVVRTRIAEHETAEAAKLESARQEAAAAATAAAAIASATARPAPEATQAVVAHVATAGGQDQPGLRGASVRAWNPPEPAAVKDSLTAQTDTGERMNLGAINEHLAPIRIDAAGLAQLGFEPAATNKSAKQYRACDLPVITRELIRHLHSLESVTA